MEASKGRQGVVQPQPLTSGRDVTVNAGSSGGLASPAQRWWGDTVNSSTPPSPLPQARVNNSDIFYSSPIWGAGYGLIHALQELDAQLVAEGRGEPIWLHIDSPGGGLITGLKFADVVRNLKSQVYVVIEGLCASAATLMAFAATKTFILENSHILIHQLWAFYIGSYSDFQDELDFQDTLMDQILRIYRDKSHLSDDEIRAMLRRETWMDAKTAIEKGFVDGIYPADVSQLTDGDRFEPARKETSFMKTAVVATKEKESPVLAAEQTPEEEVVQEGVTGTEEAEVEEVSTPDSEESSTEDGQEEVSDAVEPEEEETPAPETEAVASPTPSVTAQVKELMATPSKSEATPDAEVTPEEAEPEKVTVTELHSMFQALMQRMDGIVTRIDAQEQSSVDIVKSVEDTNAALVFMASQVNTVTSTKEDAEKSNAELAAEEIVRQSLDNSLGSTPYVSPQQQMLQQNIPAGGN